MQTRLSVYSRLHPGFRSSAPALGFRYIAQGITLILALLLACFQLLRMTTLFLCRWSLRLAGKLVIWTFLLLLILGACLLNAAWAVAAFATVNPNLH